MRRHFTYKILFAALFVSVIFVFTACGNKIETPSVQEGKSTAATQAPAPETQAVAESPAEASGAESTDTENVKVFTLGELSQFDGKDGRPAYVAVDGVVYDVSDKPLWASGEHQNRVSAGQDLSEAILSSPHGKSKLEDLPVVGTLADN